MYRDANELLRWDVVNMNGNTFEVVKAWIEAKAATLAGIDHMKITLRDPRTGEEATISVLADHVFTLAA